MTVMTGIFGGDLDEDNEDEWLTILMSYLLGPSELNILVLTYLSILYCDISCLEHPNPRMLFIATP